MKPGTLLFHGHSESKDWSVPKNRPSFFGGSMVALYYANDSPKYVTTYVLTKEINLLDLGSTGNFKKYYGKLNTADKHIFSRVTGYGLRSLQTRSCGYENKNVSEIRFCTEDFIHPDDKYTDNYAMLAFAKMICRHGFDGYYIPPIHRRAYSGSHKSEKLTEQIIICQPKDVALKVNQGSIDSVVTNFNKKKKKRR